MTTLVGVVMSYNQLGGIEMGDTKRVEILDRDVSKFSTNEIVGLVSSLLLSHQRDGSYRTLTISALMCEDPYDLKNKYLSGIPVGRPTDEEFPFSPSDIKDKWCYMLLLEQMEYSACDARIMGEDWYKALKDFIIRGYDYVTGNTKYTIKGSDYRLDEVNDFLSKIDIPYTILEVSISGSRGKGYIVKRYSDTNMMFDNFARLKEFNDFVNESMKSTMTRAGLMIFLSTFVRLFNDAFKPKHPHSNYTFEEVNTLLGDLGYPIKIYHRLNPGREPRTFKAGVNNEETITRARKDQYDEYALAPLSNGDPFGDVRTSHGIFNHTDF